MRPDLPELQAEAVRSCRYWWGRESDFSTAGLDFDSEVQVFQTAQMVRLDWQRSLTPTFLPCLRSQFPSSASAKLVSLKRIPFPKVATYTAAFRLVTEIVVADLPKERVTVDVVVAGSGRTEIALTTTTTTSANRRGVNAAEVRLARILASRFPA